MSSVVRILVIGPGGAGKSTLAAQLAARADLPLIHLDAVYWKPGWTEPPKAEWERTVESLVAGDRWVMDGNYGGTLAKRLDACQMVIFLDLPRTLCLSRVISRWLQYRGRSRPDMTGGCPEQLTVQFLWWIWTYRSRRRPKILAQLQQLRCDQKAVVLTSPAEVSNFLETFQSEVHQ